jgi:LPXTG-motif cell wall-anchored protein
MRKGIFWFGVLVLLAGVVLFFLAGASSPRISGIYGTNQIYWIVLGAAGLVLVLAGLFSRRRR